MAFGNFFNKVAGTVKSVFDKLAKNFEVNDFGNLPGSSGPASNFSSQASAPPEPPPPSQPSSQNIYFYTQTTGLKYTAANAVAGIMVHLDTDVSHALSEAIGQAGVQRFQEALRPLRRTGDLENSWQYDVVNNGRGVIIYSDNPASYSIQYGYESGGSISKLQDWMDEKPEFKNLDDRAQKRAAYFILQKIRNHYPPGPNSTLGRLAPQGERRYDYLTVVREALENDIQELIDGYVDALD